MEDNKPIYDEKVNFVIRSLTEGKSRQKISDELGYGNKKSMDIYLRRKNFRFNSDSQMYEPLIEEKKDTHIPSSSKVMEIISLLSKEGSDLKSVAKRLNFKSHIDMAEYLKIKGYIYDGDKGNYVKQIGRIEDDPDTKVSDKEANTLTTEVSKESTIESMVGMEEYLPILNILVRNKDKLIDLLTPQLSTGNIPRYAIGGTFVTKSVHMSNELDMMVRSFSSEKGINQRSIFEISLINFFKQYGYEAEVEALLEQ